MAPQHPQERKRKAVEVEEGEGGGAAAAEGVGGAAAKPTIGMQTSGIANRIVRSAKYAKLRHEKAREKKKRRAQATKEAERAAALGLAPPPKAVPKVRVGGGRGCALVLQSLTPLPPNCTDDREHARGGRDGCGAGRRGGGRRCAAGWHGGSDCRRAQHRRPPAHIPTTPPTHPPDEDQDEFAEHFKRVRPPNVLITTSYSVTGAMYKFISEMLEVRCVGGCARGLVGGWIARPTPPPPPLLPTPS